MSASAPVISNAAVNMTLDPSTVDPIVESIKANVPLAYAGLSFIKALSGVYTPNNDFLQIYDTGVAGLVPSMVLLVVDALTVFEIAANGQGSFINKAPVERLALINMPQVSVAGGHFTINLIGFNTTPWGPFMAQGVPVNWNLYLSDGTVS